mmetsp:Transcript_10542/g.29824  ORF Transcript_10542/g.29824 Transcript_10542/m.29824 type:complete len:302 (+) Transcript_10542:329-1234(+)
MVAGQGRRHRRDVPGGRADGPRVGRRALRGRVAGGQVAGDVPGPRVGHHRARGRPPGDLHREARDLVQVTEAAGGRLPVRARAVLCALRIRQAQVFRHRLPFVGLVVRRHDNHEQGRGAWHGDRAGLLPLRPLGRRAPAGAAGFQEDAEAGARRERHRHLLPPGDGPVGLHGRRRLGPAAERLDAVRRLQRGHPPVHRAQPPAPLHRDDDHHDHRHHDHRHRDEHPHGHDHHDQHRNDHHPDGHGDDHHPHHLDLDHLDDVHRDGDHLDLDADHHDRHPHDHLVPGGAGPVALLLHPAEPR